MSDSNHRPDGSASAVFFDVLRILLGWSFLWAFFDKLFGLGFGTCRAADSSSIDFFCKASMIKGGSPTYGFLEFATKGSHTGGLFSWMASSSPNSIGLADALFMLALLLLGVALMTGVGVRTAGVGGALLMFFMFLAADVWPENNPVNSSHIIEMVALLGVASMGAHKLSLRDKVIKIFPFVAEIP